MLEPKIEPDPETVTVVYELIREVPEQQVELASKLDTKMMGIFSGQRYT